MIIFDDSGAVRERREYEHFQTIHEYAQALYKYQKPKTWTLLGSTSFDKEFREYQQRLSLMGYVVLPPSGKGHDDQMQLSDFQKLNLMALTFYKISQSDAVLVINATKHEISDYIGPSTANDIVFARMKQVLIYFAYPHRCKNECPCSADLELLKERYA